MAIKKGHKTLFVGGKVFDIEWIDTKSQKQFAAQLKQKGVTLPEEELTALYNTLYEQSINR